MFKVLIVDDSAFIRKALLDLPLWGEESGFIITGEAKDAHEALQLLQRYPFDLVITDICMPDISGLQLLKQVQEKHLAPCVALLSQHAEFSYAKRALVYGAIDYLVKPVDQAALADLLNRVRRQLLDDDHGEDEEAGDLPLSSRIRRLLPEMVVERLVSHVELGDEMALPQALLLAEEVAFATEGNKKLLHQALYAVAQRMAARLDHRYTWLIKYVDLLAVVDEELGPHALPDQLPERFAMVVQVLLSVVGKFTPCCCIGDSAKGIALYMLENIDEQLSLTKVAKGLYMTRTYLGEIFKERSGISAREFLLQLKIARAKRLLCDQQLSWEEIAGQLGYSSTSYFAGLFADQVGCPPRQYQQQKKPGGRPKRTGQ